MIMMMVMMMIKMTSVEEHIISNNVEVQVT